MKEKNQVVPDEVLSKEFLSQFKTEADVSRFLNQLHAQVLEKMLEGEMDAHLGYEKNSVAGNNTGNSRNGSYPKKIQTGHGESVISIPRDRNGQFEPIAVPKHESRGLSIEKLVISLYAKGMSVSDIEEEMREIYEIELSTSAISIITNKVSQAAQEWQNRPLDPVYLIVWMDGIVFKVRMVSVNPFRLSVQVISISCTPRAFKSVRTPIQKEELSDLPTHMPRTSFRPLCFRPTQR